MPDSEIDNDNQPPETVPTTPVENMDADDPGPIEIDVVMKSILPISSDSTMDRYVDVGEPGDDGTDNVKR